MGAYPVLRRFTSDEYLRLERASDTRHEFFDGLIYAMAGGTRTHDRVVMNASFLLQRQLRGGNCDVLSGNFRIAISAQGPQFYPDLSVICGQAHYLDSTTDCALNPSLVLEVLSKSTRRYDREVKVAQYKEIPAMLHIVLISQFTVDVEHHFRKAGGKWNVMEITAKGPVFTVILNGQKTVDGAKDDKHPKGAIALQYGAGVVKFRKVEIKPL